MNKKLLTYLWEHKNASLSDITLFLKKPIAVVLEKLTEMQDLHIINVKNGFWFIHCVCKRPKKEITADNGQGTLDEVLSFFKKRQSMERLEQSYTRHDGSYYGNAEQWKEQAKQLADKITGFDIVPYLKILGLTEIPKSVKELQKVRRNAMKKHHPDIGGSDEMASNINKAYEELLKKVKE